MKTLFTRFWATTILFTCLSSTQAETSVGDGMLQVNSQYSVAETLAKLTGALNAKGMTIFTTIDHSAGAQKVGVALPETNVVIFGNPKIGSPLMMCNPSIAIDLPQKMLIWQTENGVKLAYNDPLYLATRHGIANDDPCFPILNKVSQALAKFAKVASQ